MQRTYNTSSNRVHRTAIDRYFLRINFFLLLLHTRAIFYLYFLFIFGKKKIAEQ